MVLTLSSSSSAAAAAEITGYNGLDKSQEFDANIGLLFNNVQESTLNHRRTAIALYKIQNLGVGDAEYEQLFLSTFFRHVLTILAVKKQEQLVQKLLKFVCTFMSYSAERDAKMNPEGSDDSVHQRFMESFIMFLLQGTEAKDKSVRLRICLLIAHSMQHIGEMRYIYI